MRAQNKTAQHENITSTLQAPVRNYPSSVDFSMKLPKLHTGLNYRFDNIHVSSNNDIAFPVTVAAAVGLVSCDCGILSAYISSRFSHTWSMVLGVFLTVASYLLLWSSTFFKDVYHKNSWLLILFYIIAG